MVGVGFGWPMLAGDTLLFKYFVHFVPDFYFDVWAQMWDPGPGSFRDFLAGDGGDFLCWPLVVAFASSSCFLVLHRLGVALWVVLTPIVSLDLVIRRTAAPLGMEDRAPDSLHSDSVGAGAGGFQCPSRRRLLRWLWRRLRSEAVAFEAAWVGSRRRSWSRRFAHELWKKRTASCCARVLAVFFVNRHGVRASAATRSRPSFSGGRRMAGGGSSDFLDGLQQFCRNFRQEAADLDNATSRQVKAVEDLVGRARRQPGFDFAKLFL